ncbi:MAG: hypothetical protein U9N34_01515 [Candidatus Cloacimonadota bacterium]|nr:hypothetical protein [Candidatus Cloacimonadota bacterium]
MRQLANTPPILLQFLDEREVVNYRFNTLLEAEDFCLRQGVTRFEIFERVLVGDR